MHWILKIIFVAVAEVLQAIVGLLGNWINNIFDQMYELSLTLNLDKLHTYSTALTISIVSTFILLQLFNVYILQTEGDIETDDPLELITRVIITVVVILGGRIIFKYLIKVSSVLCDEITDLIVNEEVSITEKILNVVTNFLTMNTTSAFIQMIILVIIVISLLVFVFKAGWRATELTVFLFLLPFLALDLLTKSQEKWNEYKYAFLICIFGYIIQVVTYLIFITFFSKSLNIVDGIMNLDMVFFSITWLIFTITAPKWLQKFLYNTGLSNASKRSVGSLASLITHFIRK